MLDNEYNNEMKRKNLNTIGEISNIKPGWHNGEGVAIRSEDIELATLVINGSVYQPDSIFPTLSGGVQLEYNINDEYYMEVEIKDNNVSILTTFTTDKNSGYIISEVNDFMKTVKSEKC